MSECARDYLKGICDPFPVPRVPLCIPDLVDRPSFKIRTVCRGTFASGSFGFGYILVDLYGMAANDVDCIQFTVGTFEAEAITGGTGTIKAQNTRGPYAEASIGTSKGQVQYRPVAGGMRVRYIGTELKRAGRSLGYTALDGTALNTYTFGDLLGAPSVYAIPTSSNIWTKAVWFPTKTADYEYKSSISDTPLTASDAFVIAVAGTEPESPFEYEIIFNWEYVGTVPNTTPSQSDVQGMSAARSFIESSSLRNARPPSKGGLWDEARTYLKSLTPEDISGWVSGGKAAVKLLL